MKRAVWFILMLVMGSRAFAFELTATLNTNRLLVGDRLVLTITTTHLAEERSLIPSIANEPFIVVWDEQSRREVLDDQRQRTITDITFSSFVIGEHRVATNPVIAVRADGTEEAIAFPELLISVTSVLSNPPPELADIKPPVNLPGHRLRAILTMIAVISLIAAALAWLIRWWLRRPKVAAAQRIIPPHEIAFTALNALRQRGLMEAGQAEPFYVELSAIIRLYLEQRFKLNAPEQTTEEFIRTSSQSAALTLDHQQLTQSFLEQSDLVKFARFAPGADDMQAAWTAAERLVRETIPAPPTGGAA